MNLQRALIAAYLLIGILPAYGQEANRDAGSKPPSGPTSQQPLPADSVCMFCGCGQTPDVLSRFVRAANPTTANSTTTPQVGSRSVSTTQGNFPANQVITCGKFRLYYEDLLHPGTPGGFADTSLGAARRNTLCAVLTYVQSTLNVNVNATTDFIDLYIAQSWSAPGANPAPPGTNYLAVAGPYYSDPNYGTTPGYYPGNVFLHATTGTDPQAGQYDGIVLVNFDTAPFPIQYWDDYQNTTSSCCYDLYTVLLHEVTHALGFISNVREVSTLPVCGAPNNSFTKFDQKFLYYGSNPCAPSTLQKVVTGTSPAISTPLSTVSHALSGNRIWLRNGPAEQNHPVYSGTLDSFYPVQVNSLMSHMAGTILSFTAMSQYAPGFQPNYVMGPSLGTGQRKREWTLAELRALLTLGYGLDAGFSASTSLNGTDPNGWLLNNNSPAHRTNCSTPILAYNTPYNFMDTMPADFPLTNNNTPSTLTATQLTINVASLANVADAEGDAIRVMPNTLFGIRGVSDNANNHNRLIVNAADSQIVYTPEPGFHGRAQFGFYLWDGHERGALRIVTIDVAPGSYTVTPGYQLVINPGLEDGTEMRQRLGNQTIEHSAAVDYAYEGVFAGQNFSGGHPFNWVTNWWNLGGGDVMKTPWYGCFMGPNAQNGYYGFATADWNPEGFGGFNYPTPVATAGPNERYHLFLGGYNYSTLINPVQGCNVYTFECDLNFEKIGAAVGQNFTFQLQFVNNPSPSYHTALYYMVPVNVTISTIAHNTWQHVTFAFQYCGTPTPFMNLLVQGIVNNPALVVSGTGGTALKDTLPPSTSFYATHCPFIDNISLKQVSPTPALTLSTTVSPSTPPPLTVPTLVTLTGLPVNFVPCNATYLWQPGNLAGNTVTDTPSATTTYTLTCSSSNCSQAATSSVTVQFATPPPFQLDHFKVYPVSKLPVKIDVLVQGQFDTEFQKAHLSSIYAYSTRVSKNDEGIIDPNAHLTWYVCQEKNPKRIVEIQNQFGQQELVIGNPQFLLVPTGVNGSAPSEKLDHYIAYQVIKGKSVKKIVSLVDDLVADTNVAVTLPKYFCVPVVKVHDSATFTIHNEKDHLTVYDITLGKYMPALNTNDQFSKYQLIRPKRAFLCVPTDKLKWSLSK